MYIRLSLEDEDLGEDKTESGSVGNQREFLYHFLEEHPDIPAGAVTELIDDGYSGTNLERPGMQELLRRVRTGNVQTVIVKDLSRLGRNYIEVGRCLEEIFPLGGVRFISVNDHYDSDRVSIPGMDIVFKNIIHDYYSKELSGKVLQAKKNLADKGRFLGGIPPFGYLRDPEDPHRLAVDPTAAATVKRIFDLRMSGETYSGIARILNAQGTECPEARLGRLGIRKGKTGGARSMEWTSSAVRTVLKNPAVTGTVVNHRVKRKQMGRKELVSVKEEEQIRIPGMHEAIIRPEEFAKAQRFCQEHLAAGRKWEETEHQEGGQKKRRSYPLTGLLKCGCCGKNLAAEGKTKKYYVCLSSRTSADPNHKGIGIEEETVLDAVTAVIAAELRLQEAERTEAETVRIQGKKENQSEGENGRLQAKLGKLYDQYAEGEITKEEFLERKKKLKSLHTGKDRQPRKQESDRKVSDESVSAAEVEKAWENRDYLWLKEVIRKRVERITVWKDKRVEVVWR